MKKKRRCLFVNRLNLDWNIFCSYRIHVNVWWFRIWFFKQNLMIYLFSSCSKVNWQICWKMQLTEKAEKKKETKSILEIVVGPTFRTSNVSENLCGFWWALSMFRSQFTISSKPICNGWNLKWLWFVLWNTYFDVFFYYPQKHSKR